MAYQIILTVVYTSGPVAQNLRLLCLDNGLIWSLVACSFGLLGFPGKLSLNGYNIGPEIMVRIVIQGPRMNLPPILGAVVEANYHILKGAA